MPEIVTEEKRKLAEKAAAKTAPLGTDIDLSRYDTESEKHSYQRDPSQLPPDEKQQMLKSGVIVDDLSGRSGTFIQKDQSPVHFSAKQEGIEVMSISE
ncbi:MAG: SufD family Fe-S cluster assembly protein, partial [Chloroflexi bacterium]|nr:SufD family Fe-S cluster assembly protein [Chloroflexota bacterium]